MQLCIGDDMKVSQSSGPYPAPSAVYPLREWCGDSLNFLQPLHSTKSETFFFQIAGFLGIVGAIDAPKGNENEFVNRHHYHSLNVQVVFDAKYKLILTLLQNGQVQHMMPAF